MSASPESEPDEYRPARSTRRSIVLMASATVVALVAAVLIALPGGADPQDGLPSYGPLTSEGSDEGHGPRAVVSVDVEVLLARADRSSVGPSGVAEASGDGVSDTEVPGAEASGDDDAAAGEPGGSGGPASSEEPDGSGEGDGPDEAERPHARTRFGRVVELDVDELSDNDRRVLDAIAAGPTGPKVADATVGDADPGMPAADDDDAATPAGDEAHATRAARGTADGAGADAGDPDSTDAARDVAAIIAALEAHPDIERAEPAGAGWYALDGVDAEQAATIDGVVTAEDEIYAALFADGVIDGELVDTVDDLEGLLHGLDPQDMNPATTAPTDPYFTLQWHLRNTGQTVQGSIGVPGADIDWLAARETATGDGIVVAVIDTVFDTSHPDLAGRLWVNAGESCQSGTDDDGNGYVDDCGGWNFATSSPNVHSTTSAAHHGTHVAATIASPANGAGGVGVAPDVTIMPLAVSADGGSFPMSRVAAAIDYAVDNGAHLINASLGTSPGAASPSSLAAAVDRAESAGVLLVAAAGNDTVNIDQAPVYPASLSTTHTNVLTVGATDNRDQLSSFSNYGQTVQVSAPGTHVLAAIAGGGWGYFSGTSMATPIAAGAAALVAQAHSTTDPQTLIDLVVDSAKVLPSLQTASSSSGRVDAAAAVAGSSVGPGEPGDPGEPGEPGAAAFTFGGLADLRRGQEFTTTIELVGEVADASLGLVTWHEGAVYAVNEHRLHLAGDAGTRAATTGGDGSVVLAASLADATFTVRTTLPDGRYAFVVEYLDDQDAVAVAAPFIVGSADDGADDGGSSPPGDGGNVPPPSSGGGGTAPPSEGPGGSAPGDTAPPPGDDGGPAPGTGPPPGAPGDDPGTSPPPDGGTGPGPGTGDAPGGPGEGASPPPGDGGNGVSPPQSETNEPIVLPRSAVLPNEGPAGTQVRVFGTWPANTYALFGGIRATTKARTDLELIVQAPQRSRIETVTVTLVSAGEVIAIVPEAYTYLPGGGSEGATNPPENPGGTPPSPPDDGGVPPPSGRTVGEPIRLPNGLLVTRVGADHPASRLTLADWSAACTSSCSGRQL